MTGEWREQRNGELRDSERFKQIVFGKRRARGRSGC